MLLTHVSSPAVMFWLLEPCPSLWEVCDDLLLMLRIVLPTENYGQRLAVAGTKLTLRLLSKMRLQFLQFHFSTVRNTGLLITWNKIYELLPFRVEIAVSHSCHCYGTPPHWHWNWFKAFFFNHIDNCWIEYTDLGNNYFTELFYLMWPLTSMNKKMRKAKSSLQTWIVRPISLIEDM